MQAIIGIIILCLLFALVSVYRRSLLNERLRAIEMSKFEWIKETSITHAQAEACAEISKNLWRKQCTIWYAFRHMIENFPLNSN